MPIQNYIDTIKSYASEISIIDSVFTIIISAGIILSFITKTGRKLWAKLFLRRHPKSRESASRKENQIASSISALIIKLQDKNTSLSTCLSEALEIALKIKDSEFIEFCNNELTGWAREKADKYPPEKLRYREVLVYTSLERVNMSYVGFRTERDIFNAMEDDPDNFIKTKMVSPETVSTIEDFVERCDEKLGIISNSVPSKTVMHEKGVDGVNIHYYSSLNSYRHLLSSIKAELIRRLIEIRRTIS